MRHEEHEEATAGVPDIPRAGMSNSHWTPKPRKRPANPRIMNPLRTKAAMAKPRARQALGANVHRASARQSENRSADKKEDAPANDTRVDSDSGNAATKAWAWPRGDDARKEPSVASKKTARATA